jgi:hypothetical protein
MNMKIVKSLGTLALSAATCVTAFLGLVSAQENATSTNTGININIDVSPLISLVISLLPVILTIVIIKAMFEYLGGFARISKWFKARINALQNYLSSHRESLFTYLSLGLVALVGLFTGGFAQESSLNIDISGLINIVIQLLPLIIVLVVIRAIMDAFKGMRAIVPFVPLAWLAQISTSTIDLSWVLQLVMAILPLFIIVWLVKTLLDAFGKMF